MKSREEQLRLWAWVGLCLAHVQTAERALQTAIQTVLDDENVKLSEQSEPERKQTLGDFLKKLKRRVKLPYPLKDKLYNFLEMRNRLVHSFDFDRRTEEGHDAAMEFVLELTFTALSITGLVTAIFQVWARDEHDQEFYEVEDKATQAIIKHFEKQFGELAREVLAGRNSVGDKKARSGRAVLSAAPKGTA